MGRGEDPEPVDRGGGLPRRLDPQVPRRQRGYYIGGAGHDDAGYFVLEQDYGGAGGDDSGSPEQVFDDAGRFVGGDLAPLAEGIVPRPGGSPGRKGRLPFARGRAPLPVLEDPPGAADDDKTGGHHHGEVYALGAADPGERVGATGHGQLPLGQDLAPLVEGAPRPGGSPGRAPHPLLEGAAGHGGQAIRHLGAGRGGQANRHLPLGGAGDGQHHGANHRPPVEVEPNLDIALRANRNHPDRKGKQLMTLDKRYRSANELADSKNEDLLDLIASMEALRKDIEDANRDNKHAAKKMAKDYKGALSKAKQLQKDITRARGVPRSIPPKLLVLPSF